MKCNLQFEYTDLFPVSSSAQGSGSTRTITFSKNTKFSLKFDINNYTFIQYAELDTGNLKCPEVGNSYLLSIRFYRSFPKQGTGGGDVIDTGGYGACELN